MRSNVKHEQQRQSLIEKGRAELVNQFLIMCQAGVSTPAYQEAFVIFEQTRQMLINQGESWSSLRAYVQMAAVNEAVSDVR